MTEQKMKDLTRRINELTDDELVEFQRMVSHVLGLRRSIAVLSKQVERPGKRGKRWPKGEAK